MEDEIKKKYLERIRSGKNALHDLRPQNYGIWSEFDRETAIQISNLDRENAKVLIVGAGYGAEVFLLLRYGVEISNIYCVDMQEDRVEYLTKILPGLGGYLNTGYAKGVFSGIEFDLILCSTVLSSLSHSTDRISLLKEMNNSMSEFGTLLIYDMNINNINNADVSPVKERWIRRQLELIQCLVTSKRITLLPYLSRRVFYTSGFIFNLLNCIPFLKTHKYYIVKKAV